MKINYADLEEINRKVVLEYLKPKGLGWIFYWQDTYNNRLEITKLNSYLLCKLGENALNNARDDLKGWKRMPQTETTKHYIEQRERILKEFERSLIEYRRRF